jgi:hypothetical protein
MCGCLSRWPKAAVGKDGKKTPITFDDYLAMSRDRFAEHSPKETATEKTPGILVPVLMNPANAIQEFKDRAGRSRDEYLRDYAALQTRTEATILNRPGTEADRLQFERIATVNGLILTEAPVTPIKIADALKEALTPAPTPPVKTPDHAPATSRRGPQF